MNLFIDREIKRHVMILLGMFLLFICVTQLYWIIVYGSFQVGLLFFSLIMAGGVLAVQMIHERRQVRQIEEAIDKINCFLAGDASARIECNCEGRLYQLFHAVNTLGTTLEAQAAQAQTARTFLKETISDISHQLKTPLAALNIYHSLLQEEKGREDAVEEFALKSEKEVERIEGLVQNLLKITKLDAGVIQMEKKEVSVPDLMEELLYLFETRACLEGKTISLTGPKGMLLCCDRGWMSESVSNLIKNALDHTVSGDQISIEWKKLPLITQMIVKDNGSGIHPEDLHHIFKRFYRSRFSKDRQGIGLGLPLAKAITEVHGGSILVDSELGKGSVFVMSFPNLTEL